MVSHILRRDPTYQKWVSKRDRIKSFTSSQALERESKFLYLGNALFSHLSSILNLKISDPLAQARELSLRRGISSSSEPSLAQARILPYSPGFHPPRVLHMGRSDFLLQKYVGHGKFYAGLHTTSRCEGLHSQMGRCKESGYNVTEFLHHFQRCLSPNEVVEDFKSSYGDVLLQTPYHNLEGHAALIYTRVVFKEFREVLLEAAKLGIISTQQTSTHVIYKIEKHYSPNKK
ncbi:hypothetical protein Lal_00036693 [Lupinus albus]|nr:hypothetical protein Lal_00036693 [Lupinus albus]